MKLNLGCGKFPRDGYVNIDYYRWKGYPLDRVWDLRNELPYEKESIDEVYSSHTIEHFWWSDVKSIIGDWYRVLKKEGRIELWTVDLYQVIKNFEVGMEKKEFDEANYELNKGIFNQKRFTGDPHHTAFTFDFLKMLLEKVGFTQVKRLDIANYQFNPIHDRYNMGVEAVK